MLYDPAEKEKELQEPFYYTPVLEKGGHWRTEKLQHLLSRAIRVFAPTNEFAFKLETTQQ
jgi:hypothetical protein